MERLGPPPFDEADRGLRRQDPGDARREGHRRRLSPIGLRAEPTGRSATSSCRSMPSASRMIGSTDVGDVSWVVPTVQALRRRSPSARRAIPGSSTAQGKSPARAQGHGACGEGDGRHGVEALCRPGADRRRQGRPQDAHRRARPMSARCRPTSRRRSRCRWGEGARGLRALLLLRHCERSEAIQLWLSKKAGFAS